MAGRSSAGPGEGVDITSGDQLTASSRERAMHALLGIPFTHGNDVKVLRNGDQAFPALLDGIGSATHTIDMAWFLWGKGPITSDVARALAARARDGVRVRVLLDGFGAHGIAPELLEGMRASGCQVRMYRPLRTWRISSINMRNHSRILICDDELAFTGGTGIDEAWTGDAADPAQWRDTAFQLRGPAVDGLRGAFAIDWSQTPYPLLSQNDRFPAHRTPGTVTVQVSHATSQPGWNASFVAILALLYTAHRRVRICTPYARVPDAVVGALHAAVRRGAQVQLLVPGPHVDRPLVALQGHHRFQRLLDIGVEIWQYQPTMLHAKVITVDGEMAMSGTTNLDTRSLALNGQMNLVISDRGITAELDADFDHDLARSEQLSSLRWRSRPRKQRVLEMTADMVGRPLRGLGNAGQTGRRP